MSYLVLARKYRPRTFSEVVGQEVLTRTLTGAISEGRIGHAYLFHGPRGTGKTTSARIFAKALNCERGPTPEPCGECERCRGLDAGTEVDTIEIDAASNTGVEHVRELRDQAGYVPMRARYKIYIVDEVHMLSKQAFNALLKTLEEPPPHVKFLFATTELHKVLDTIQSRCQVLRLDPIDPARIEARLDEVFRMEGVEAESGVTAELARRARGGMRDALSLADQLLALVGTTPRLEDLSALAREGSTAALEELLDLVERGDKPGLLGALPATEGGEGELLSALLEHLRGCLVAALCGPTAPMLRVSPDQGQRMAERGKRLGGDRLEAWIQEGLLARERMRTLPTHARLVLESTLLELATPAATVPLAELVERLAALEEGAPPPAPRPVPPAPPAAAARPAHADASRASAAPRAAEPAPVVPAAPMAGDEVTPAAPPPVASPAPPAVAPTPEARTAGNDEARPTPGGASRRAPRSTAETWSLFLEALAERAAGLAEVLRRRGKLAQLGDQRAVVQLSGLSDPDRLMVTDERNRRMAVRVLEQLLERSVELVLEDSSGARPGSDDPFTREVAELFEGRIED